MKSLASTGENFSYTFAPLVNPLVQLINFLSSIWVCVPQDRSCRADPVCNPINPILPQNKFLSNRQENVLANKKATQQRSFIHESVSRKQPMGSYP